uniref:Uncharacterized protein n=1 Tax=Arundo donax TaxID=35708 RepID=A0A0A8ZUT2_ARUDO
MFLEGKKTFTLRFGWFLGLVWFSPGW